MHVLPARAARRADAAARERCCRTHRQPATHAVSGDLLTILVHFGRNLDTLVPRDSQTELDGVDGSAASKERLNSYVVASVGNFASPPDVVQCRRGGDVDKDDLSASTHSFQEGRVLYEQTCSPYAATRVVEDSTSPSWNEVLAIPLPPGWSVLSQRATNQGESTITAQAERGADAGANSNVALKVELVERGASHQEDFLLATCLLPLAKIPCQLQQTRFAFAFPAVDTKSTPDHLPAACIYLSLHASSRGQDYSIDTMEQVEIVVESFTPVVVTGSEDEGLPLDCTSLAAVVNLRTDGDSNTSLLEPVENFGVLENHFIVLHDGQEPTVTSFAADNVLRADVKLGGITPSASSITGSASGVYKWFFPFSFVLPAKSNKNMDTSVVDIALFKASVKPHKLIGRGHLKLSSAPAVMKDGLPLRHTVIPMALEGDTSRVLGHFALRLRWWEAPAWKAFVADIPARRVVCTNRRKRSPRPTLVWMGALLRGLNRHPVTSICDAGGVSGILAELLTESPTDRDTKPTLQHLQRQQQQTQKVTTHNNDRDYTDTSALLREQLAHLQAEGTAQRHQIERLQNELDTRLAAIKTCGLEIVALRDAQLQKLKEQVESAQHRDQQQLAELLAPNGSAFLAHPELHAASQRFTLLASKYKELDRDYQSVKQQLASAQQSLAAYEDLEARHARLQEAHLVQAALVQRLRRDKQHAAALEVSTVE
ncbi:unnamed protein product [Phytophthora lilii]|uniref:Unnamed protein product n=1 Tax=Phytophthora lilii TaxID=2077276 RepID=A0A9W6TV71_9STRA|nr:unnamed protein product [Phytophthora lilii]